MRVHTESAMRFVTAYQDRLLISDAPATRAGIFSTGLPAVDDLLPQRGLARGGVHELLHDDPDPPLTPAVLFAKAAAVARRRCVVVIDVDRTFHPPAAWRIGIEPSQLLIVRPTGPPQALWAVAECLRCPAVAAVIAPLGRLNRTDARRLRLAAESTENAPAVAILLRPAALADTHAAVTRWRVGPAPGERLVQRWKLELFHGHGRPDARSVYLEIDRERHTVSAIPANDRLRATDQLADRPLPPRQPFAHAAR